MMITSLFPVLGLSQGGVTIRRLPIFTLLKCAFHVRAQFSFCRGDVSTTGAGRSEKMSCNSARYFLNRLDTTSHVSTGKVGCYARHTGARIVQDRTP